MSLDIKKIKAGGGHLWYHLHENWSSKSLKDMEDCPDCPEFNVSQANLLEKYDFMAFVMKYVRCTTKWGDLGKWQEENERGSSVLEQVGRASPVLCFQLVQIMSLIAAELGMNSRYVHFTNKKNKKFIISHWGIDIELKKKNWAFYDPTYFFCVKDPLPLSSRQIKNRPELLDLWHKNFSQVGSVFMQDNQIDNNWPANATPEDRSLHLIFRKCSIKYVKTT